MTTHLSSKIAGKLTQHGNLPEWWESDAIPIPFFENKPLAVVFNVFHGENEQKYVEAADEALQNFLKLTSDDKNAISELAYKNCFDFLDAVDVDPFDDPLRAISDKQEIWNFIYPTKIYVERRYYQVQDLYVYIACECAWEQEHGLQFVFRQGRKLTRVSDQDGHLTDADAYGKPDSEDELLSKF
jgi:hypothetical protein